MPKPDRHAAAFSVFWSADRISKIERSGYLGKPLPFLFGGPHASHPSPAKSKVAGGDRIFPIGLKGGRLMVLCECIVDRVVPIDAFHELHGVKRASYIDGASKKSWLGAQNCEWLAPTCTDDAVLLQSATPLQVNQFLPLAFMPKFRILLKNGQRDLSIFLTPENLLKNSCTAALIGRYVRLAPKTAEAFSHAARLKKTTKPTGK